MRSKKHVKHISVSNESHNRVGFLGELEELSMVEGAVLEVKGTNGVLGIDLSEDDLRKMLSEKSRKR